MNLDDFVFCINSHDRHYGQKFIIRGIETTFDGRITMYMVSDKGHWKDFVPTDLQYTTRRRRKFTPQLQLL